MSKTILVKKTLKLLPISFSASLFYLTFVSADPAVKHVAITQYVEHVAADAVRQGFLEELEKKGYREGENLKITFENAQGSSPTAVQIARKFLGLRPDVIVAITTPSAQAVVKAVRAEDLPVVFSAVTDPVGAGLVSSLTNHPQNVTGVMDAPPVAKQLHFIKTLLPEAKRIGVLYNPGDSGSVSSLKFIREQAQKEGLTLTEATPVKSSDIQGAVLGMVGKVDAIYVPLDNMVVSAMGTVSSLALKHKIPVFSADSGSVKAGALACLGYSYLQTGYTTGDIVAEVLEGTEPREISVASPTTIDVFINKHSLETLKLSLPEEIRAQAYFY